MWWIACLFKEPRAKVTWCYCAIEKREGSTLERTRHGDDAVVINKTMRSYYEATKEANSMRRVVRRHHDQWKICLFYG